MRVNPQFNQSIRGLWEVCWDEQQVRRLKLLKAHRYLRRRGRSKIGHWVCQGSKQTPARLIREIFHAPLDFRALPFTRPQGFWVQISVLSRQAIRFDEPKPETAQWSPFALDLVPIQRRGNQLHPGSSLRRAASQAGIPAYDLTVLCKAWAQKHLPEPPWIRLQSIQPVVSEASRDHPSQHPSESAQGDLPKPYSDFQSLHW